MTSFFISFPVRRSRCWKGHWSPEKLMTPGSAATLVICGDCFAKEEFGFSESASDSLLSWKLNIHSTRSSSGSCWRRHFAHSRRFSCV